MVDKYTEDIAVDGSLIQKELGFVPQYDLKTGWEEVAEEDCVWKFGGDAGGDRREYGKVC